MLYFTENMRFTEDETQYGIPRPVIIGVRPKGCWFVPRCGHLTRNAFLTQPWNFGATLSRSMESLFDYHV